MPPLNTIDPGLAAADLPSGPEVPGVSVLAKFTIVVPPSVVTPV